jgi:hypothetical protein
MYRFSVIIKLRVSLNFSTVYRGLMITSVYNLQCGWRYTGHVSPVSEFFSVPASISEGRHLLWFYKFLVKDIPLQIFTGWTRQAERLINLHPPIIKKSSGWGLRGELSHLLHICQLKFRVAWVQKDTA